MFVDGMLVGSMVGSAPWEGEGRGHDCGMPFE